MIDAQLAVSAFVVSILLVPLASRVARLVGLIDRPSIRKRHVGEVPLAGGMVLLVCLLIALPFMDESAVSKSILFLSIPLFLLGAIDDRLDLSAKLRLLVQMTVGVFLVFVFDISVSRLDGLVGTAPVILSAGVAAAFTIVCACGVLNAVNMCDGIDGLLGGVASISLFTLGWLANAGGAYSESSIAFLVFGMLVGYLLYNLGVFGPQRRIFLGDSGSMLVGLILLVLVIELSQSATPVITPTSAGWLLGLPLLDTVSVMVRRVVEKRSPFAAGRDHFHHFLQDVGLSRGAVLVVLLLIQGLMVGVGVWATFSAVPQAVFFWGFVALTVTQFAVVTKLSTTIASRETKALSANAAPIDMAR